MWNKRSLASLILPPRAKNLICAAEVLMVFSAVKIKFRYLLSAVFINLKYHKVNERSKSKFEIKATLQ